MGLLMFKYSSIDRKFRASFESKCGCEGLHYNLYW